MAFAIRCLFFLVAIGGIALFLYLYRRRVNLILILLLVGYAVAAGSRLLTVEQDEELLRNAAVALGGLGLVWAAVWLGALWLERRGPRQGP